MQDAWLFQILQIVRLGSHCPNIQTHGTTNLHQPLKANASLRDIESPPDLSEIDSVTVISSDHDQTGKTTFGRFRLHHRDDLRAVRQ